MRSKTQRSKGCNINLSKEELLDDPLAESLYGLFLTVKDSPRHIAIKPEKVINEAFRISSIIHADKYPDESLGRYEREIEFDLGWKYAVEIVMTIAHKILICKQKLSKAIRMILGNIEIKYGRCCYWGIFHQIEVSTPVKTRRKNANDYIAVALKELREQFGQDIVPQIVLKVQQAEINVNSPGNQIVREQINDYNK